MKIRGAAIAALLLAVPAMAQHHRHGDDRGDRRPGILLFAGHDFQGDSYFSDHEIRKLSHKGLDDRVSSIRVMGGVWAVCKDDDFHGRCVTITHSIRDTRAIGMDNKISSVRLVSPGGARWRH